MNSKISTNDYNNIKQLYNVSAFFGLAPRKTTKWYHTVYLVLFLICFNVSEIYLIYTEFANDNNISFKFIHFLSWLALLLFTNISIIQCSILCYGYQTKYKKFLDTFLNFPVQRKSYIWIQILIISFIYGPYIFTNVKSVISKKPLKYLPLFTLSWILELMMLLSCLVIVNYAILLKARFEVINKRLQSIFAVGLKRNVFLVRSTETERLENECSNNVQDIRKSYTLLSRTVKYFNQLFGIQILILYFCIFIGLLEVINYIIIDISKLLESQKNLIVWVHLIISLFFWLLILMIMGVLVAVTCDMTTREARRTATICYNLLLDVPAVSNNIQDCILREELILLAQQATHQYPYISAAAFFNVDYSMLFGLLGSVTSYVIVLLQINK